MSREQGSANLRYVSDDGPGVRRLRHGSGFQYRGLSGQPVRDAATLRRIRSLAIPPAWNDVWICPRENGHIQATGKDARGRKQYLYHPRWREMRNAAKYEHIIDFGRSLPAIRRQVQHDLTLPGLPREKVLAAVVRLLETTLIRVGNEEYQRQNGSYGLTTLRNRHARIRSNRLHFEFKGKSGVPHEIDLEDRRLAEVVRDCQDLPGQELFEYLDADGTVRSVHSEDVNDYLHAIAGSDCTAKDFRTWSATVLAVQALRECHAGSELDKPRPPDRGPLKKNVVRAIEQVASRLRNTVAVCRKSYIHPLIFAAYEDGRLLKLLQRRPRRSSLPRKTGLSADERGVLNLLVRNL